MMNTITLSSSKSTLSVIAAINAAFKSTSSLYKYIPNRLPKKHRAKPKMDLLRFQKSFTEPSRENYANPAIPSPELTQISALAYIGLQSNIGRKVIMIP